MKIISRRIVTQHNATHEKCIRMAMGQVLTRAREGGGQIFPFPHVFRRYKTTYRLIFMSFSVPDQK